MSGDLADIFSRKLRASGIGREPVERRVAADAAECAALAELFGLPGIAWLTGDFTLAAAGHASGVIEAELVLGAKVTQTCVVSLENFDSVLTDNAALRFVPAARIGEAGAAELTPDSLADPDELPYTGDSIDLGAALAEQLALALDPYPRKPGAELSGDGLDRPGNPFAALRRPRRAGTNGEEE